MLTSSVVGSGGSSSSVVRRVVGLLLLLTSSVACRRWHGVISRSVGSVRSAVRWVAVRWDSRSDGGTR